MDKNCIYINNFPHKGSAVMSTMWYSAPSCKCNQDQDQN